MTMTKVTAGAAAALALVLVGGGALAADESPCPEGKLVKSGTFEATKTSVGLVVGIRWGGGELKLNNGEVHKFKLAGGKLLETGVSEVVLTGEVYNLDKLSDFTGTYYGSSAQISLGKSAGEVVVNNDHCVVLKAKAKGEGLQLSAPGPEGFEIDLTE